MQELVIEDYDRLGLDWRGGGGFIHIVDGELPHLIAKDIGKSVKEIHDLTCGVIDSRSFSRTGSGYRAEKMLKLKIKIQLEAELVDDTPIPEAEQEIEKKIRVWKDYGGTRTEALEKIKKEKGETD